MESREYLEQVGKIDKLIENKIAEMAQWQAIAEGTSSNGSGERVQTSASLHKMEDAVVRIVDIESEIEKLIHKYISYKQEVIETLEQLETTSYDILHKFYIQGMQIDEIASIYHSSVRSVLRKKGKALKQMQIILNKREKDKSCH